MKVKHKHNVEGSVMKKRIILLSLLMLFSFGFGALSWCGDSYVVGNGTWYTGSNSYVQPAGLFHGANLGELTSLTLGGECQSWDISGDEAKIGYKFDADDGTIGYITLNHISSTAGVGGNNDQWQINPGPSIDISGLSSGAHTIEVWFWVRDNDASTDAYDNNSGGNYIANFTIPEGNPLAISLASFVAHANKGKVELAWTTATETENDHFNVYRDGEVIASIAGNGTCTGPHDYTYTDAAVEAGKVYEYKISDVSWGGLETVHAPVNVEIEESRELNVEEFVMNMAYPNPFNPSIKINYQLSTVNRVTAAIYNTNGELIKELISAEMTPGSYDLTWDASGMPSGVYIVKMVAQNTVQTQKVVLMK
jgi:Secretion system C-terminal sorting domain